MDEFKKGDKVEVRHNNGGPWFAGTYLGYDDLPRVKKLTRHKHIVLLDYSDHVGGFYECRRLRHGIETDDPVWIWENGKWSKFHFAAWGYGGIFVWPHGETSHTAICGACTLYHTKYSLTPPDEEVQ